MSTLIAVAALVSTNAANREQQRIAEGGQIAELFGRAVEQMDSDKLGTRLGGIHTMETLMIRSRLDREAIVKILVTFVRERAPDADFGAVSRPVSSVHYRVAPDVQAALTAIAGKSMPQYGDGTYDFSYSNLAGADLSNGNLVGWKLANTDLSNANLSGTNLARADLTASNLRAADLTAADLTEARLNGADLTVADLTMAQMRNAELNDVSVSGTGLETAVGLTPEQFIDVRADASTRLPRDLRVKVRTANRTVVKVAVQVLPKAGKFRNCDSGLAAKFLATITVDSPVTLSYRWNRDDGAFSESRTLAFGAAGRRTVSTMWHLSGYPGYEIDVGQTLTIEGYDVVGNRKGSFRVMCN